MNNIDIIREQKVRIAELEAQLATAQIERNANDANIAIILRALGVETVDDAVRAIAAAEAEAQRMREAFTPLITQMLSMQGDGFFKDKAWVAVLTPAQAALAPAETERGNYETI